MAKKRSGSPTAPPPSAAAAPEEPRETTSRAAETATGITVNPVFLRNPDGPRYYAPLVDVRTTPHGLHLLLFVPPAADSEEIVEQDGQFSLPVRAQAEVILPPDAVEPLILSLAQQYRGFVLGRLKEESAAAGIELDENIEVSWIDGLLALARQHMEGRS